MSDNLSQLHYIKLWLKSVDEPLLFPVAEAAWGRFERSFQTRIAGFFIFATLDGRTLALNLKDVRLAQVWSEASKTADLASHDGPEVILYYADRRAVSYDAADPVDLARIFANLKPLVEDQTLNFTDTGGRRVLFSTDELLLFETSTDFLEEGYRAIYLQERGTLPPVHLDQ